MAIQIDNRFIGPGEPVFVVAEIGVNHNGNLDLAKHMVKEAKKAGADCAKFQTFKAERLVRPDAPKANYQLKTTNPSQSQFEMLKQLEIDEASHRELITLCRREGITFLSTPYNHEDVDLLVEVGSPALKLASMSCNEPHFLAYAAKAGLPLVLSSGMASLAEIDLAVSSIRGSGLEDFALLQCTTNYPSPIDDANLRVITTLRQAFGVPVGYSDHTQSNTTCIAAVALGASVIEKHFTTDKSLVGPDQSSSCDPSEFAELVRQIRDTERALGSPHKSPSEMEILNSKSMRRSLVARNDLRRGARISDADIGLMRPADGLSPQLALQIVGLRVTRDIAEGEALSLGDFSETD